MPDAPTAESIQQQLCCEIQTLLSLKSGSVIPIRICRRSASTPSVSSPCCW